MDTNLKAKQGATPLMVACSNRHKEICDLLLNRGCEVNIATQEGWTALHVAVRACSASIVKRLLHHGADPNVISAKLTHNSDVVPASTPLLIAIALNSMKIIRHLYDANCDINMPGTVCMNPSFSSSESEEESKIIEKQKCYPCQFAILSRAWDICALLMKSGCDVTPIRKWLEEDKSPVSIPPEKLLYLRILLNNVTTAPPKLRHLLRRKIRDLLGRDLLDSVYELAIPLQAKHFILYHEFFRHTCGSFEVLKDLL
jgi:ankyrin repeat protein